MLKIFLSILLGLVSTNLFGQAIPNSIYLERNKLNKIAEDATPSGNAVEYIEFMGTDVWIATSIGLSKSTDAGETWTNYKFGDEGISALGINRDTVWVATWHPLENSDDVVPVGTGLHYSADKGETWIDIPQPVDAKNDSSIVYGINTLRALPLPVPEGNFTRDIEFMGNTVWIASFYGGLRKSSDVGKTWQKVVLPPDYLDSIAPTDTLNFTVSPSEGTLKFESNLNHRFFSLKSINDSTIFVGTANGINKSTDGGISWIKFNHQNQTNPISGNFVLKLDYDVSRNTIWAATWKAEGETEFYGLSSTPDFGDNWKTFLASENVHDVAFTKNANGNEDNILVATDKGVFRSADLGKTFTLAPQMQDENTNVILNSNKFRAVNAILDNSNINNIWFGSEGGTALLKETIGIWKGNWRVFLSSPALESGSEAIAFPNPFKPGDEQINIKYSFNGDSKSITIRIFDFGMNLVKTIIQNANRIGGRENTENWNGRDENNNIVPNGVYFFRIDYGNDDQSYGKIMVLK
ncbi:MAG: hypothetical protein KDC67_06760 [Ignavibacteriae bacterium]|nr:hypothetical protein [Ignavibacteriota bacterium]